MNETEKLLIPSIEGIARLRAELARARDELAAVDEALDEFYCPVLDPETDEPCGSYWKNHGINMMRQALDSALQAAQEQSDEIQELWLSPAEAEGLKRQLAKSEAQIAAIKEAVEWLWGFWDGNSLRAIPGFEDDIRDAWGKLLVATDTGVAAKLLERLATLDAAEAALADCGIGGIYDDFDGLTDAIEQMSQYINELTREDKRRTGQVRALQAEHQLRQEAEQRAERAEVELSNGHKALTAAGTPQTYKSGQPITIARRVVRLRRRTEALAGLATLELAGLLVKLAGNTRLLIYYWDRDEAAAKPYRKDAEAAYALAAKIREVLDER